MSRKLVTLGGLALLVGVGSAFALTPQELDREIEFISGLVNLQFPDLAERQMDQLGRLHPEAKGRFVSIEVSILMARGKFDEAEKMVNALPAESASTWAAKLAMADRFYRSNQVEKAQGIYKAFFGQYKSGAPKDKELRLFFVEAAYRYSQMLDMLGDLAGSAKALDQVLQANTDEAMARQLQMETAQAYVRAGRAAKAADSKALYDRAWKLCDDVIWKGIDLWFGKAVVMQSQIALGRGDKAAARRVLRQNLDIMKEIDKLLTEEKIPLGISPMADVHFTLAQLGEEEGRAALAKGKKDEAIAKFSESIKDYILVMAKYGDSKWGPEAVNKSQEMKELLEQQGKTVSVDLGKYQQQAVEGLFRVAEGSFIRKEYAAAADNYLKIINLAPKTDKADKVLMSIMMSFVKLGDALAVKATALQIGERYGQSPDVANVILAAAKEYFDAGDKPMHFFLYDTFLLYFPKHERTPSILYTLANLFREENPVKANAYLQQLIDNFQKDRYYLMAVSQLAWDAYQRGAYAEAAAEFAKVVEQSQPNHARALAQYSLADSLMRTSKFEEAAREYRTLQGWLAETNKNPYGVTTAEIEKNKELLEKASFYIGYCLSRMQGATPEATVQLHAAAIQTLEQFVKANPASEFAPKALNAIGTIHLDENAIDKAMATFEDLSQRYPQSDDGKSALYQLIKAALELKKFDLAHDAYEKMKADKSKYGLDQFVRIGQGMLDGGLPADAADAFEQVRKSGTEDRALLERTLFGLGRAYYETQKYEEGAHALDELMLRYEKTGLFYEVKLLQSKMFLALKKFDQATEALSEIFKFTQDPLLTVPAGLELARIQRNEAEKLEAEGQTELAKKRYAEALASLQRIALFGGGYMRQRELIPLVEASVLQSIELFAKTERYGDAVFACDQYITLFPKGEKLADVRQKRAEYNVKTAPAAP